MLSRTVSVENLTGYDIVYKFALSTFNLRD